jgi:carboxyl-terminal processing protease
MFGNSKFPYTTINIDRPGGIVPAIVVDRQSNYPLNPPVCLPMPRRSLQILMLFAMFSLVCYVRADRQPYGRYLSEVFNLIDSHYVEPVNHEKLFESAVKGMVDQLDEHTAFITRESLKELREGLDQKFGGVGIEVTLDPETKELTVLSPIVGTPAYEAGLRSGDKIVAIDGQPTIGFSLQDAVKKMRGVLGQPVELQIARRGVEKPFDVVLTRAPIAVESVRGEARRADGTWDFMLADHPQIGYIRLSTFGERTAEEMSDAVAALQAAGAKALILDLRENPGGLLPAAISVCELFVPQGSVIVTTRGRNGVVQESFVSQSPPQFTGPMVVLVNRFSASASEIVAACLQDYGRAKIVGERSFGKGTVQKIHEVEGGRGVLKLTTSSYWRPSGKNINRLSQSSEGDDWGVRPDKGFDRKMTDAEIIKWHERRRQRDILPAQAGEDRPDFLQQKPDALGLLDPQLKQAVKYLAEQLLAPIAAP